MTPSKPAVQAHVATSDPLPLPFSTAQRLDVIGQARERWREEPDSTGFSGKVSTC